MAKRTRQGGLLNKALKGHAQDETDYGRDYIDLPSGITGGIAKLVEAKLGIYQSGNNEGEKFLHLAGVVLEPKVAIKTVRVWENGKVKILSSSEVTVEGQRTSQTLALCDVTKADGSVNDMDGNIESALNELRKVGGKKCTAEIGSEEDLADVLEALKESAPFFRFSTTSSNPTEQYPIERIWENWRGTEGLEDYEPEDTVDVVDATGEEEPEEEETDTEDLAALGEAADKGDDTAEATLSEKAEEVEIDPNDFPTWAEVATAIEEAPEEEDSDDDEEGEEEGDEEEEEDDPEKGEVYGYKPPRKRKAVECEVLVVFPRKKTCNLKSLDDGKMFKGVPFSKLEESE